MLTEESPLFGKTKKWVLNLIEDFSLNKNFKSFFFLINSIHKIL